MPHLRSPEAARARRLRAEELGFLQPTLNGRYAWVRVPRGLAAEVKVIVASLCLHREHEEKVGRRFHYARHASAAALNGEPESFRAASTIHRKANVAKHSGFRTLQCSAERDLLQDKDPWARVAVKLSSACAASPAQPPAGGLDSYNAWRNWRPSKPETSMNSMVMDLTNRFSLLEAAFNDLCSHCLPRHEHFAESITMSMPMPVSVEGNIDNLSRGAVGELGVGVVEHHSEGVQMVAHSLRQTSFALLPSVGTWLRSRGKQPAPESGKEDGSILLGCDQTSKAASASEEFNLCGVWRGSADGTLYRVQEWSLIDGPDKHNEFGVSVVVESTGKTYNTIYEGTRKCITWADEIWTRV